MTVIYLGLGTNMGERYKNLVVAVEGLRRGIRLISVSSVFETAPVGYKCQGQFYNIALKAETELSIRNLLYFIQKIENEMGRTRLFKDAPRIIDIDILIYGMMIINERNLTIPHPGLAERDFVLKPLVEIEPGLVHPVSGRTVSQMLLETGTPNLIRRLPFLLSNGGQA